ncbi:MAG: hypothetical protein QNJ30_17905 [Kiloniellales bacterium]|nr:hypothetical protein [Kiloniellales bacterium]
MSPTHHCQLSKNRSRTKVSSERDDLTIVQLSIAGAEPFRLPSGLRDPLARSCFLRHGREMAMLCGLSLAAWIDGLTSREPDGDLPA